MKLAQLRSLDAVARNGSVRRAAAELGVTQPSVSEQIRVLEGEVGFALLERGARGSRLTRAGSQLLPQLQRVLRASEAAEREAAAIRGARAGSVHLAAVRGAFDAIVGAAIGPFAVAHPEVQVDVRERHTAEALAGVEDGTFDLVIVGHTGARPELAPPLRGDGLGAVDVVAAIPRRFAAAVDGRRVDWSAVPWVVTTEGSALRVLSDRALAEIPHRVVSEVNDAITAREFVRAGVGGAFLPRTRVADLDDEVFVLSPPPTAGRLLVGLACVHDAGRWLSPAARTLRAMILASATEATPNATTDLEHASASSAEDTR